MWPCFASWGFLLFDASQGHPYEPSLGSLPRSLSVLFSLLPDSLWRGAWWEVGGYLAGSTEVTSPLLTLSAVLRPSKAAQPLRVSWKNSESNPAGAGIAGCFCPLLAVSW